MRIVPLFAFPGFRFGGTGVCRLRPDGSAGLSAGSSHPGGLSFSCMRRVVPALVLVPSVVFSILAACPAYSGAAVVRRAVPHKFVDKYLKARQRGGGCHFSSAGVPVANPELAIANGMAVFGNFNYYSDKFGPDSGPGIARVIARSRPGIPADKVAEFCTQISRWAAQYDLPPLLVAAVIHVESNFDEKALYLGNYGPMQVNLTVHAERMRGMGVAKEMLQTVEHGIRVGCSILKECIAGSGGSYVKALTWYNGGMNPNYAVQVLRMYEWARGVKTEAKKVAGTVRSF